MPEWERAIQLWIDGEAKQVPKHIVGPRVLRVLYGTAALVCSHLTSQDVKGDDGLEVIKGTLRGSTLIQELEDVRGDAVQKEFMAMRRMSGESFDSFLARAALLRREMLKHDKEFQMGERYYVGFLLDNAEITNRDRAMVLGSANNVMREAPIAMALRRMGPYLAGKVPIGPSEHTRPILQRTTLEQLSRKGIQRKSHDAMVADATPVVWPEAPPPELVSQHKDLDVMPDSDEDVNDACLAEVPEELNQIIYDAMVGEHETFVVTGKTSVKVRQLKKLRG